MYVCVLPVCYPELISLQAVGGFHNNCKPPEGLLVEVTHLLIPKTAESH